MSSQSSRSKKSSKSSGGFSWRSKSLNENKKSRPGNSLVNYRFQAAREKATPIGAEEGNLEHYERLQKMREMSQYDVNGNEINTAQARAQAQPRALSDDVAAVETAKSLDSPEILDDNSHGDEVAEENSKLDENSYADEVALEAYSYVEVENDGDYEGSNHVLLSSTIINGSESNLNINDEVPDVSSIKEDLNRTGLDLMSEGYYNMSDYVAPSTVYSMRQTRSLPGDFMGLRRLRAPRSYMLSLPLSAEIPTNKHYYDDDDFKSDLRESYQSPADIPEPHGAVVDSSKIYQSPTSMETDNNNNNNNDNKDGSNKSSIDLLSEQLEKYHITSVSGEELPACICHRKILGSFCLSCKNKVQGRTYRNCARHPKMAFEKDNFFCPHCMASLENLIEILNE